METKQFFIDFQDRHGDNYHVSVWGANENSALFEFRKVYGSSYEIVRINTNDYGRIPNIMNITINEEE